MWLCGSCPLICRGDDLGFCQKRLGRGQPLSMLSKLARGMARALSHGGRRTLFSSGQHGNIAGLSLEQRRDDLKYLERTCAHNQQTASTATSSPPEVSPCQLNRHSDPLSPVPAPSLPRSLLQPPSPPNSGVCFLPSFSRRGIQEQAIRGPPLPRSRWNSVVHQATLPPNEIQYWFVIYPIRSLLLFAASLNDVSGVAACRSALLDWLPAEQIIFEWPGIHKS